MPIPTIKYYLRECLLPPGEATARNQARYGEVHLRRLRLIRTMTGIGGLDLSSVRRLLIAIDDERVSLPEMYQIVNRIVYPDGQELDRGEGIEQARRDADSLVASCGWQAGPLSTNDPLVRALAALRELGCDQNVTALAPMAKAAERLAVHELDMIPPRDVPNLKAVAVVRTVLFRVAFDALRRMAREHHLLLRLSQDEGSRAA